MRDYYIGQEVLLTLVLVLVLVLVLGYWRFLLPFPQSGTIVNINIRTA